MVGGDYQVLAMVMPKYDGYGRKIVGCRVVLDKYLEDRLGDYKNLVDRLKSIEDDATYCLSPRSTCERIELEERGVTWKNGHYYIDGEIIK